MGFHWSTGKHQKYVDYGKDTLERKVSLQVSLLQKSSSSSVSCHATGLYPSGVTIFWMKNEQDHDEDVDLGELLPNEHGTFQRTSTLRVSPDELKKNQYSCVVEHQDKTIREILRDAFMVKMVTSDERFKRSLPVPVNSYNANVRPQNKLFNQALISL